MEIDQLFATTSTRMLDQQLPPGLVLRRKYRSSKRLHYEPLTAKDLGRQIYRTSLVRPRSLPPEASTTTVVSCRA